MPQRRLKKNILNKKGQYREVVTCTWGLMINEIKILVTDYGLTVATIFRDEPIFDDYEIDRRYVLTVTPERIKNGINRAI